MEPAMSLTPENDQRPKLSYPGDIAGAVLGQRVGPTAWGEFMWIDGAEYNPVTDRTRCTLAYRDPSLSPTIQAAVDALSSVRTLPGG